MFEVDSLRALRSYLLKYPNIQHDHTSYIDPEGRRAFQLWMIERRIYDQFVDTPSHTSVSLLFQKSHLHSFSKVEFSISLLFTHSHASLNNLTPKANCHLLAVT